MHYIHPAAIAVFRIGKFGFPIQTVMGHTLVNIMTKHNFIELQIEGKALITVYMSPAGNSCWLHMFIIIPHCYYGFQDGHELYGLNSLITALCLIMHILCRDKIQRVTVSIL